jgi:hypothetical protein
VQRLVRVEMNFDKFKKYGAFIANKVNGSGVGSLTEAIKGFGQNVVDQVLTTYEKTASWKEDAVRKRIYKYGTDNPMSGFLAQQLDYTDVERTSNQWILSVTNPTMYPLGEGIPYYALWQEGGSAGSPMTPYIMRYIIRKGESVPVIHPGLPARDFINAGFVYAYNNAQRVINETLNRWVKEARNL